MRVTAMALLFALLTACQGEPREVHTVCGVQIGTGKPACIFVTEAVYPANLE